MFTRIRDFVARSLRYKLLLLGLLPIVIVIPAILGLAVYQTQQFTQDQLLRKVSTDLRVTHDIFLRLQRDYLLALKHLAESHAFRTGLQEGDAEALRNQLEVLRVTDGFDSLNITDLQGRWLLDRTTPGPAASKPSPLVTQAVQAGRPGVGVEVYSAEELQREAPQLRETVRIAIVDTPHSAPAERGVEERAMVVRAVYPIRDRIGQVVALLDGWVLLNRNFGFVDAIRDLVYGPGSVPAGGWGAVTVLLGDVRITTNVPVGGQDGERALGTRASEVVRDKVLGAGATWVDRAFVVSDWYLSGYEPVVDVNGEAVGMLYAGYIEAPFRSAYHRGLTILSLLLVMAMAMATLLAVRGAKTIFRPIQAMTEVIHAEAAGERRRIGAIVSQDEIGELARRFDALLNLLDERNRQIQLASEQLETKVEERTAELSEKNLRLQNTIDLLRQTRRQLVMAEKLAALGELTAGVAHEINNPTAVILGNVDVLISELAEHVDPVQTELDLIIEQVYRIRAIVDRLLQYSRPAEYAGYLDALDVHTVIDDTLMLIKHEIARKNAAIETDYAATSRVNINRQELQQVLVNLLVNALHASSSGGKIELSTREWSDQGVMICVRDHGAGIPSEQLDRVFDPFFTTKKEEGTGLGLSVSYGLMRRYGGRITVESTPGEGTRFDVYVRREPVFTDDDEALMERYLSAS